MSHWRRLGIALGLLLAIVVGGTVGYSALGFGPLDALYQTVTTIATVGFREVRPFDSTGKVFTMVLILAGVGVTLYAFTVLIETVIEGRLQDLLGRRRMERTISTMHDHVIICGWGRVGRAIAKEVAAAGRTIVVIDHDAERLAMSPHPTVLGDATDDAALDEAGIDRAASLIAAVDGDADNSFITLSARTLRPDLFIVSRARTRDSERKLLRAGADRVVNPQNIGGARMAAFVLRPHVAEFLDVVMHEQNLEFRLEEFPVLAASSLVGTTIGDARIRERTGSLVLAVRTADGQFLTNPSTDLAIEDGHVVIAIGTEDELRALEGMVAAVGAPDADRSPHE